MIDILRSLKNLGNSVLIVEHDEDVIMASDYLVDIGPGAGNNGGSIMYCGATKKVTSKTKGPTAEFIFNKNLEYISNLDRLQNTYH